MNKVTEINFTQAINAPENKRATRECLAGIFCGVLSLAVSISGHRFELHNRTVKLLLSGSMATMSVAFFRHGAYLLKRWVKEKKQERLFYSA